MDRVALRDRDTTGVVSGSAAASIVAVWLAGQAGVTVPPEVASALTTLISAAAAWVSRDR